MRRAVTLVELVLTVTIAVVIFAAALMVYNFSNRSRGVTATARALQTALLIQEHLMGDLGRLVPAGSSPLNVPADDPGRLSFYVFDPAASTGREMKLSGVVYALPKKGALLTRESGGKPETIGTAPLERVEFTPFQCATGPYLRVTLTVGREDGEPAGPATVHSFLAPVNVTSGAALHVAIATPFKDEKDEPARELPDL